MENVPKNTTYAFFNSLPISVSSDVKRRRKPGVGGEEDGKWPPKIQHMRSSTHSRSRHRQMAKKTLGVGGEENGGESAVKKKGARYEDGWLCLLREKKEQERDSIFLSKTKHPRKSPFTSNFSPRTTISETS